ncbi:arsenite methyltransferase isoform X3 [Alosa pseudoharengus]|uniref:arsenite methyltransferase isoform X3 n=1 Tax=Alosa pseudoharengus TaxID=34774 RepID=UPI003F892E4B
MASQVHESIKNYYGSRLETSADLQTSATSCSRPPPLMRKSARDALKVVHPDVCKRFFGCGLVIPEKLEGCKVLDLGSGSGRDCYVIGKMVGEHGQVTGIDMTESLEGGELYFSDMYASEVVPESFKEDPVLWGEGMAGSLYWQDLISMVKEIGFSTPNLVAATHIVVHNCELLKKTGGVKYASGTYRFFKLPKTTLEKKALVTYKGTVLDCAEQLDFDASHSFKTNVAVEVDGEMATVLQCTRFSADFSIQMLDTPHQKPSKYCHLSPFLLADKLGASVKQCSKTGVGGGADGLSDGACGGGGTTGGCGQ